MVGSYSCTRKSMIVQLLYIHTVKIHERELRSSRPPLHHKPQVTRVGAHLQYTIHTVLHQTSVAVVHGQRTATVLATMSSIKDNADLMRYTAIRE